MSWIETYCGKQVSVQTFVPDMVEEEDIAHSLSMQCRYNGHTRQFYSVAEHSCLVSDFVWRRTKDKRHALAALLHDASEAYLCDIPRPFKHMLANYRELEEKVGRVIASKFDLDYPWSELIQEADFRILLDERRTLFRDSGFLWEPDRAGAKPLGVRIECLTPQEAKACFLERFYDLY